MSGLELPEGFNEEQMQAAAGPNPVDIMGNWLRHRLHNDEQFKTFLNALLAVANAGNTLARQLMDYAQSCDDPVPADTLPYLMAAAQQVVAAQSENNADPAPVIHALERFTLPRLNAFNKTLRDMRHQEHMPLPDAPEGLVVRRDVPCLILGERAATDAWRTSLRRFLQRENAPPIVALVMAMADEPRDYQFQNRTRMTQVPKAAWAGMLRNVNVTVKWLQTYVASTWREVDLLVDEHAWHLIPAQTVKLVVQKSLQLSRAITNIRPWQIHIVPIESPELWPSTDSLRNVLALRVQLQDETLSLTRYTPE